MSAMYLGHRQSEDLDLFTTETSMDIPLVWDNLTASLIRKGWGITSGFARSENFASGIFCKNDRVTKVDLVYDVFFIQGERHKMQMDNSMVSVDFFHNIVPGKLSALISRGSKKDILDINAVFSFVQTNYTKEEVDAFLDFVFTETIRRDSNADDHCYLREIFTNLEEKYQSIFNRDIASWMLEYVNTYLQDRVIQKIEQPQNPSDAKSLLNYFPKSRSILDSRNPNDDSRS